MATLVNVCGSSHSGTTALDLMIGSGHSAFSCGEVYAVFRPWRSHHFAIRCPCGTSPCPVWSRIADGPASTFHSRAASRLGVEFVVDSSKNPRWVLDTQDWARRAGLGVRNLLIWKSPERFALSYWKRGWGLRGARDAWLRGYQRYLGAGVPLAGVSHAALSRDPATTLRRVCAWVGQPYREGQERFWEHTHHHLFGSGAVRRQVQRSAPNPAEGLRPPPGFRRALAAARIDFDRDTEVAGLLRRLEGCDVDGGSPGPPDGAPARRARRGWRPRPLWYHREAWWSRYKRLFPEPWPEETDAAPGETDPKWPR